jgi:hypothetical protein
MEQTALLASFVPILFAGTLDPAAKIHVPIGIANTLDTLKTFVDADGTFSPGVGSYGVYFWIFDPQTGRLISPAEVKAERGLSGPGYLIPWVSWTAAGLTIKLEICEIEQATPGPLIYIVGARVHLTNPSQEQRNVSLYAALRPLGPAGWAVNSIGVSEQGDALLVDGQPALVAHTQPSAAGVLPADAIGQLAQAGKMPTAAAATSNTGDCSGALHFDLAIPAGKTETLGFVCPVLPGRRAARHQWDGVSTWAQLDLAKPNPTEGGLQQIVAAFDHYRNLRTDELFDAAARYWRGLVGRATISTPDPRWGECFAAITGHAALCMNEGAPDVAVVNYNVFNRDGVYIANIMHKSGNFGLAAKAIDYFLGHPFNGRVYPEADNPGQVLWIIGEHWRFTRDREWLQRVYPSVRKLVAMVRYYRTTPGPHYVCPTSLDFGDALPADKRQELKPGSCDGHHPEYTEAFDIAGLRGAVVLAEALGSAADADEWRKLADTLFQKYDQAFGARLPKDYGSYSVLWPCRLYPFGSGKAYEQFKAVGAQKPTSWRYFPLATAHQGLLAGSRQAGYGTLDIHLNHEQMRGWYVLDEGGDSGPGGWRHLRTNWKSSVAMPHGWAIAELHLLLRDCLLFEDGDRLVLLGGVPAEWFARPEGILVENLPTQFGACSFKYERAAEGDFLTLSGQAAPPGGFALRLPKELKATVAADGKAIERAHNGDFTLPANVKKVRIGF